MQRWWNELGSPRGLKVLDLGCGDGTTAIPEAQQGAEVLGVDIARNLVEAGDRRVAQLGLTNITFREGDATNLQPIPDNSFDLVVSIFGAMFAPRPFDVAREMVRVDSPGRAHCHGQLDSQRSHAGGADPQDLLCLHATAA